MLAKKSLSILGYLFVEIFLKFSSNNLIMILDYIALQVQFIVIREVQQLQFSIAISETNIA